jgi:hypothetical protein
VCLLGTAPSAAAARNRHVQQAAGSRRLLEQYETGELGGTLVVAACLAKPQGRVIGACKPAKRTVDQHHDLINISSK